MIVGLASVCTKAEARPSIVLNIHNVLRAGNYFCGIYSLDNGKKVFMGQRYSLKCTECNSRWELSVGYGIGAGDRGFVLKSFKPKYKARVKGLIEALPVPPYGFSLRICKCSNCQNLVSVPTILKGDKKFVESCPDCGHDVELLDADVKNLMCPKCSGKVVVENINLWD